MAGNPRPGTTSKENGAVGPDTEQTIRPSADSPETSPSFPGEVSLDCGWEIARPPHIWFLDSDEVKTAPGARQPQPIAPPLVPTVTPEHKHFLLLTVPGLHTRTPSPWPRLSSSRPLSLREAA